MYVDLPVVGLSALPMDTTARQAVAVNPVIYQGVNLLSPFGSQPGKPRDPRKFVSTAASRVARASGISFPNLNPTLKTIIPGRATLLRHGVTHPLARPVGSDVNFPKPVVPLIAPLYMPIKDRIVFGQTNTAATLTNQSASILPPTLSIVPPPPTADMGVGPEGMVQIIGPDASNAEIRPMIMPPATVETPADTGVKAAGFPVIAGVVIVLLALGMFTGKGK
jgi:hypothetical protein